MSDFGPELVAAIRSQLAVSEDLATRLAVAAMPLWAALEQEGMVDGFGGMECERVLPAALAFIRESANRAPDLSLPVDWTKPPREM